MITIDIFTDAGVFKESNIAVSVGVVLIDRKKVLTSTGVYTCMRVDYAECAAINKTLARAYEYCRINGILKKSFKINVYTDSLTNIDMILSGIDYYYVNPERAQMLSGIRNLMKQLNGNIQLFHIKSHIFSKNFEIPHIMFCKKNNVDISLNDFLYIYKQNKKCDELVSEIYRDRIQYSQLLNPIMSARVQV